MTRLACCMAVVLALGVQSPAAARAWKARNVVIIVIDGPRYTETWGHPEKKYVPVLAKSLAPRGVVYTNFRCGGATKTNPGHTAVTSGFYDNIKNNGKELPSRPTILQRFLQHSKADAKKAWLVTSKDKLEVLADSKDPQWKGKYRASTWCGKKGGGNGSGYGSDTDTLAQIKRVLQKDAPRLLVVNFREPDSSGHARKWKNYLQGIRDTDRYVGEIVGLLDRLPAYRGKTALFVTNDHGRHRDGVRDGYVSHGDGCEGCRHILLYAMGPDFKRGAVIDTKRDQIDIAVTAAAVLGFPIPGSKGAVMTEMLRP